MTKTIKVSDIKWAYSRKLDSNLVEGFIKSLCLFVGEILRSDEIGLIVWQHQAILMVRIHRIDFETEVTYVDAINFKDSGLKEMLKNLNLDNNGPAFICSCFEVFCYRPKLDKPYHPKIHPTYIRARERASRILDAIFTVAIAPGEGAYVSFAQVDKKTSTKFFKKTSNQNQPKDELINFAKVVGSWIGEFYTDEIGSKQYKTKNRYPIAPKPLEGCELHVITSDDDGNLISYQAEV
ncbi:hypothetical protein [Coleofasciculus sp. FACHB-1120]|uniref:hypothetical protein n=1 Tax=Coleofasciculus sp. FACHB-1120 TaxID=2692783 RepID=UPI00168515D0|nr:hypothetical protein [Coleofasciculus sp. FACHB-1120]MBD2742995.1 hypothetical protein [Coleofasciculus sp. FACHB-1120]